MRITASALIKFLTSHFYSFLGITLISLFVLAPLYPTFFSSSWGQDLEINWIYQYQLKESLSQNGSIPQWSPYTLSGYPMGSSNVAGLFYPLQALFFFLPITFTFNLLTLVHLIILGINMYLLAYFGFGLSRRAAFITSVSFLLTPRIFNDLFLGHFNWLESLAWLPLTLLLFIKMLEKRSYFLAVSTGLVLSLMIYTFSVAYIYALFVLAFYFCFYLVFTLINTKKFLPLLKAFLLVFVAIISSLLFCSVFLFNFLNFLPNSLRVQLSFWDSAFPSIYRESLIQLFFPLPDRIHQGETLLYFGLPTLALSLVGIIRYRKKWQIWCLLALVIFALTVSFGANEIFFKVYYRLIPVFQIMRNPLRIWTILIFGVVILSGFGAEFLLTKYKKKASTIFAILMVSIITSLLIYNKDYFQLTNYETKNNPLYNDLTPDSRIYCLTNCLADSEGVKRGLQFSSGGEGVLLDNYYRFMDLAGNWKYDSTSISIPPYQITDPKSIYYEQPQPNPTLLGLSNTKYIISPYELSDDKLDLKNKVGDSYIYENQVVFPRAFIVPNAAPFVSLDQLKTTDFQNTVVIDGLNNKVTNPGELRSVTIEQVTSDRLKLQFNSDHDGFLVIGDTFYPGWKAFDNGKEVPILQANGALRALQISSGQHVINLRYLPDSFVWGTFVSLTALAIYGVWALKKLINFLKPSSKPI